MKRTGKNGSAETVMENKETWKALDLFNIAVSDKGRIMVNGDIIEPSPPYKSYKRYFFEFTNPKTGKVIKRDAAIMVWRAFKGKVSKEIKITFKDGDMSNLNLENLQWEYITQAPKYIKHTERTKKTKLTVEQMKARVPQIIERMVEMWGVKD